jgi:glycosyltransferase involved in cell wall biosynthesis
MGDIKKEKFIYISAVLPAYNEEQNIKPIYSELKSVLSKLNKPFEIIFVNDGSTDNTQKVLEELYKSEEGILKIVELKRRFGKAATLKMGFISAKGELIITLDSDLQDDPNEIPKFLKKLEGGFDLVSGWKQERKDSLSKILYSKIFNFIVKLFFGIKLHDFNSGFKLYKSEVVKRLNIYGELHRYIPILAKYEGYKIAELPIAHRKRKSGNSKYGMMRIFHGFFDLITIIFLTKYRARPLHFFGYIGLVFFLTGFVISLYLTSIKIFEHESIGDRPLLLFGVMMMIFGVQIGIVGVIAEQLATFLYRFDTEHGIKKVIE